MIPYGRQDIDDADINAVIDVLKSDFLTQGPRLPAFENIISEYTGANFSVAVSSATAALHIACRALQVTQGDIVWTSPITFVASANCAIYCGASVDFVDVDPQTGNMSAQALKEKLELAQRHGCLPKVVIPVHLAGHCCDMEAIAKLARQYDVKVIEDASHAIGGSYRMGKVGNCQYADITVFSFHPVKIVTTAEGGIATTQDEDLAEKMRLLRSHGIVRDPVALNRPNEGDWYYEQQSLGFNYRMTELQAALGISQMQRLDHFVERRNQLADCYKALLNDLPLDAVEPLSNSRSAYHLFIVRLDNVELRKFAFDELRRQGIQAHVHYFPVHLQPYFEQFGFKVNDFPAAEYFYKQILTLPLFPRLQETQLRQIVSTLSSVLAS